MPADLAGAECFGRPITLAGTPLADRIVGTPRRDVIVTLGGDDLVTGVDRDDRVCTGGGDDDVEVGSRDSFVRVDLGAGDDTFTGAADRVRGGPGDDELRVVGSMSVEPGPGRDLVVAQPVRDRYAAPCLDYRALGHRVVADLRRGWVRAEGVDRIRGLQCLEGTRFADVITGSPRNDMLSACDVETADEVEGARDTVRAGAGDDEVTLCDAGGLVFLGDGRDTVMGSAGDDWVYGGAGADYIWGESGSDHLFGEDGDDQVNGTFFCDTGSSAGTGMFDSSPNWVYGGPGDDEVTGDRGADRLDGGPGFDHGYGGPPGREGADVIVSVERRTSCR